MTYEVNLSTNPDMTNEGFYAFYQKMNFVYNNMKIVLKENKAFKRYLMKLVVSPHITHTEKDTVRDRVRSLKVMVNTIIFNVLSNTQDVDLRSFKGLKSLLRKIRVDASKNVNLCRLISAKPTKM